MIFDFFKDVMKKIDKEKITQSSAVNVEGYVLDAREKNPSISGTMANQISELNTNFTNDYVKNKTLVEGDNYLVNKTLPAGTYLVIACAQLVETSVGRHDLYINGGGMILSDTFQCSAKYPTACTTSVIVLSKSGTVKLNIWETATAKLNYARLLTLKLR